MSVVGPSKTEIERRAGRDVGKAESGDNKSLVLRSDFRFIVGSAVGGLSILIVLSLWIAAGRIPFIVGAALPLFTLIAIIYQAVVYRRQWNVMQDNLAQTDRVIEKMEGQEAAMRDQVRIASDSLKISQRAYVGVHSLEEDFKNDHIVLMLENIGNVPAKSVKVAGEVWVVRHKGIDLSSLGRPDFSPSCPFSYDFGQTGLFRGNLKAQVRASLLNITLKDKTYIPSVIDGRGTMWVTGRIEYEDGFDPGQITEFAFVYGGGKWMVRSIDPSK